MVGGASTRHEFVGSGSRILGGNVTDIARPPFALPWVNFLQRHALSENPRQKQSRADLLYLIERIGFVQVDSINTVARAHDMMPVHSSATSTSPQGNSAGLRIVVTRIGPRPPQVKRPAEPRLARTTGAHLPPA